MSNLTKPIVGLHRVIIVGSLCVLLSVLVAGNWNPLPLHARSQYAPLAYRVPKMPGGTPLRLAMIHDVLHERYLRHGQAWYSQRIIDSRKIIAAGAPASDETLGAMDDLAIALERTGQFPEAIAVMRKKLAMVSPLPVTRPEEPGDGKPRGAQWLVDELDLKRIIAAQNLSSVERQQYSACANLGTILVLGEMHAAMTGDAEAEARMREGLELVEKSIDINPGSHFGRERWQAIAIETLLAAIDHPDLLSKYDLIGEPLGSVNDFQVTGVPRRPAPLNESELTPEQRVNIRENIPRVGINEDWAAIVHPDYSGPMPFDEPALAIIGMWTLGGGPNPHFAIALGHMMLGLQQREIAWNAFERAMEMKDQFWPDKVVCDQMVAMCKTNQNAIASEESSDPSAWQEKMRQQHVSELAWGNTYQKAYQDYEAQQIAAGKQLNDPAFYDAFFKDRPSIASSPGLADDAIVTALTPTSFVDYIPCAILAAGIGLGLAMMLPKKFV